MDVQNVMEKMQQRNREMFVVPPYILYVARAFSTLEGIGLSANEVTLRPSPTLHPSPLTPALTLAGTAYPLPLPLTRTLTVVRSVSRRRGPLRSGAPRSRRRYREI